MRLSQILCGFFLFICTNTYARFLDSDAEAVDKEDLLSSEYYNDVLSYRVPSYYNSTYETSPFAALINAGSLDGNDFLYEEKLKFAPMKSGDGIFTSFKSEREEEQIGLVTSRELTLGYKYDDYQLGVLADPGAQKQFIDLGVFLQRSVGSAKLRADYWISDALYSSKKQSSENSRSDLAKSLRVRVDNLSIAGLELSALYEEDFPVEWQRVTHGYRYEYGRNVTSLTIAKFLSSENTYRLHYMRESKSESREEIGAGESSVALRRQVSKLEFSSLRSGGFGSISLGLGAFKREAAYTLKGGYSKDDYPYDLSKRWEPFLLATHMINPSEAVSFQYGVFINKVTLEESLGIDKKLFDKYEVKAQSLWDLKVSKASSILLNITWDLDQVMDDQRKGISGFRPWGGGHIAFLMVN